MAQHKCPHCSKSFEVEIRFTKAPAMQSERVLKDRNDIGEMLSVIDEDELDDMAAKFVTETRERFEQYGARTRMSEKQLRWLERIANGEFRRKEEAF